MISAVALGHPNLVLDLRFIVSEISVRWLGVLSQVVADDQGTADAKRDQTGEQPGANVEWCRGEGWGQHEAEWVEADGERESNHGDDQSGTQHAYTATLSARLRVQPTGDHGHTLSMFDIAQEHDEAKEDG